MSKKPSANDSLATATTPVEAPPDDGLHRVVESAYARHAEPGAGPTAAGLGAQGAALGAEPVTPAELEADMGAVAEMVLDLADESATRGFQKLARQVFGDDESAVAEAVETARISPARREMMLRSVPVLARKYGIAIRGVPEAMLLVPLGAQVMAWTALARFLKAERVKATAEAQKPKEA